MHVNFHNPENLCSTLKICTFNRSNRGIPAYVFSYIFARIYFPQPIRADYLPLSLSTDQISWQKYARRNLRKYTASGVHLTMYLGFEYFQGMLQGLFKLF